MSLTDVLQNAARRGAPPPARDPAWDAAIRASGEHPADEAPRPAAPPSSWADRWARVREEARALGGANVNLGHLLWVDRRCVDVAGLHGLSPAWLRHFAAFYASGAFEDVARVGLRGAKSDSGARAVVAETVLMERVLAVGIEARCPVMSANVTEAGDRFATIRVVLRAVGYAEAIGRGPHDIGQTKTGGGGMAPQVIHLHDAQGHEVKFQVSAANESAAAGFTGIAGLGDELDLWGKSHGANPAANVLRVLRSRYATQPQAKLHLYSASYERDSEHARLIRDAIKEPKAGRYIARIGEDGARADHEARLRLAAKIGSADPLLVGPPLDPASPDIPSWTMNPILTIEEAHSKSASLREMFALYGGRVGVLGGGSWEPSRPTAPRSLAVDPRAPIPRAADPRGPSARRAGR